MGNGNQFKIWHVDIILISANPDMSHVVYDPNLVLACYPSFKSSGTKVCRQALLPKQFQQNTYLLLKENTLSKKGP